MNLKLWEVEFDGLNPVGNCLIILAENKKEAIKIAQETITHTPIFIVKEVKIDKPKVVVYLSGDY